jgi:hypothetical protein
MSIAAVPTAVSTRHEWLWPHFAYVEELSRRFARDNWRGDQEGFSERLQHRAVTALLDADFDPTRGVKPTTFIYQVVRYSAITESRRVASKARATLKLVAATAPAVNIQPSIIARDRLRGVFMRGVRRVSPKAAHKALSALRAGNVCLAFSIIGFPVVLCVLLYLASTTTGYHSRSIAVVLDQSGSGTDTAVQPFEPRDTEVVYDHLGRISLGQLDPENLDPEMGVLHFAVPTALPPADRDESAVALEPAVDLNDLPVWRTIGSESDADGVTLVISLDEASGWGGGANTREVIDAGPPYDAWAAGLFFTGNPELFHTLDLSNRTWTSGIRGTREPPLATGIAGPSPDLEVFDADGRMLGALEIPLFAADTLPERLLLWYSGNQQLHSGGSMSRPRDVRSSDREAPVEMALRVPVAPPATMETLALVTIYAPTRSGAWATHGSAGSLSLQVRGSWSAARLALPEGPAVTRFFVRALRPIPSVCSVQSTDGPARATTPPVQGQCFVPAPSP